MQDPHTSNISQKFGDATVAGGLLFQGHVQGDLHLNNGQTLEEDRHTRFLGQLVTLPYLDRKDRNPEREPGTCEWFTSHDRFQLWKDHISSRLLWVSADPGCGKSVLSKYLVDQVIPPTKTRVTSYFFFKDDFEDQRTAESALRCILHQIFLQRPALLSNDIITAFEQDSSLSASFGGLWRILTGVASQADAGEIVCLIDALDECETAGQSSLLRALNKFYGDEESTSSLKFLVTSRPYFGLQRDFTQLENRQPAIHLSGEGEDEVNKISREVDLVIKARVRDVSARLGLQDDEESILLEEFSRVRHRTYLWAYLVLDVVQNSIADGKDDLRARVRKLPQTVEEVYEKILDKSSDREKARRLLHIVVAAHQPLSLPEMAMALAIRESHTSDDELELQPVDRFQNTVRQLCGLFVVIVDSKIYLLHQTAREFLVQQSSSAADGKVSQINSLSHKWRGSLLPAESEGILARICMLYLSLEVADRDKPRVLLNYSARCWDSHFISADKAVRANLTHLAEQLCDVDSQKCTEWLEINWKASYLTPNHEVPNGLTALMVATIFGIEDVVERLLPQRKSDLYLRDSIRGRTPLIWACEREHWTLVKKILHCTPSIRFTLGGIYRPVNWKDADGYTPLHYAADYGASAVVEVLLRKGADVAANSNSGETPLHYAARSGHKAVIELLLKNGAMIEAKDERSQTPLFHALNFGQEVAIETLRANGANLAAQNSIGWTPIHDAIYSGHGAFIKLLADDASLKSRDPSNRTPLALAVERGEEDIVRTLIANGADVNSEGSFDFSPLHTAAFHGQDAAADILLAHGAAIEGEFMGSTPLVVAIRHGHGHEAVVKLLLAKGADASCNNHEPLHAAVYEGHAAIVELLLANGAALEARDSYGCTPLSNAVSYGHKAVVELLLANGADTEAQDKYNNTPLHLAALKGNSAIIEMLLASGADIEAKDSNKFTPLCNAANYGHESAVEILLAKSRVISDEYISMPLFLAAGGGHKTVLDKIIAYGTGVETQARYINLALFWAKRSGEDSIVEILEAYHKT